MEVAWGVMCGRVQQGRAYSLPVADEAGAVTAVGVWHTRGRAGLGAQARYLADEEFQMCWGDCAGTKEGTRARAVLKQQLYGAARNGDW